MVDQFPASVWVEGLSSGTTANLEVFLRNDTLQASSTDSVKFSLVEYEIDLATDSRRRALYENEIGIFYTDANGRWCAARLWRGEFCNTPGGPVVQNSALSVSAPSLRSR